MKTRQSKLNFIKNEENENSKKQINCHKLVKCISYECVQDSTIVNTKAIPKLIIRNKNRVKNIFNENTNFRNLNKDFDKHSEEIVKIIDNDISFSLPILSDEVISKHIQKCSKYSKAIDCKNLFYNFLSKVNVNKCTSWNELYAPKKIENFLTNNFKEISKFKEWLQNWKNRRENKIITTSPIDSDDSDFEYLPQKKVKKVTVLPVICLVEGSCGSGKSCLVYSAAAELDYKVLEMNCSSRRTNKDIMDKLENATVNTHITINMPRQETVNAKQLNNKRKSTTDLFTNSSKKTKLDFTIKRQDSNFIPNVSSVFLFDDVDVVMAEDRGFWKGICSLIDKDSRPIVVTGTDTIELKKFIGKLGKTACLSVKIEPNCLSDIAVYLQLVLLSRGSVVEHRDLVRWIKSFSGRIPDLRSCLHRLQFHFSNNQLTLDESINYVHWAHYKLRDMSFGRINGDLSTKSLCEDDSCSAIDSDLHSNGIQQVNMEQSSEILCAKTLRCLGFGLNHLSSIDSQRPKCHRNIKKKNLRDTTIDACRDSYYDNNASLTSEISETLISLYNKYQHNSLTNLEENLLSLSPTPQLSKPQKERTFPNQIINNIQSRVTTSVNIRSSVSGFRDRFDRLNTIRTLATFENNRKSNFTTRRFHHYFDRAHFNFEESDSKYLTAQYNNI